MAMNMTIKDSGNEYDHKGFSYDIYFHRLTILWASLSE